MEIRIDSLVEGARRAEGLVVVIDVFRAFTTAAYIFANGAEKIIPVAGIDEALELRRQNPNYVLTGERKGVMPAGFDYGNSPCILQDTDFSGKTAVMSTSAGTCGIICAKKAGEIVLGSFVCAKAVADYILKKRPDTVTLVALGNAGLKKTDEDELCAAYIKELLQ
ncbi:2-phosphosulfolactate phosphatase, partial [Candidatus Woesearchaeota archaeon]|nr:2-phosphosulfolactate phosphatase [Candidatus Woesearchaeota archaeon]